MGTVKDFRSYFSILLVGAMLAGCSFYPAPTPTAINPPTFPQKLPEKPTAPPVTTELPPPVTENRTFVTVGGVPEYRIGRGDVLEVTVTKGPTQEKYQAQVRANGRITVSLVDVPVDGLTADQAAEAIARELSTYFRKPGVDVQVKEYRSKRVSVLGAVGAATRGGPGNYYLNGRTTLVELISTAGGTPNTAAIDRVQLTRESGKTYTVNMFRVLQQGDLKEDVVVDAGDTVYVPERPPGEETRIFLLGEVKKPGPIPFYANMTMAEVIAGAGGWTDNAQFKEARLIRWSADEPVIVEVDLQQLILNGDRRIDQVLRPNDVVFVPRTGIADYNAILNQLMPTLTFITQGLQPVILWQQISK
jgi:polysaccharide export outer membrane protein